jgi:soluble lytic murein transglycosylase-like protein
MLGKCFSLALAGAAAVMTARGAAPESAAKTPEPRVTTVVRPDARTGRLVRSVVVSPKFVPARTAPAAAAVPKQAPTNLSSIIDASARANQVDPLLVHAVIQVESNYNQYAISPKGAEGLMQLIPSTARQYGVSNSFDARQNIEAGVRHLKYLQELFQDDRLALAAYNAGEGAVQKYRDIPPYPETEQYVYRVGRKWGEARRNAAQAAPAPLVEAAPPAPVEPPAKGLETYTDSEGRVFLRTKQQ